ncbi:hypothetical protein scyTo_0012276 [Scyliorhinus torazame]|uniref:Uncharacterized protein n=1 Tax=Scyliorhinus torazame TaxID=75743 RepID=A0A401P5G5_SCYTO|nr:hypothetical protein [Scyliorhinus torazame]
MVKATQPRKDPPPSVPAQKCLHWKLAAVDKVYEMATTENTDSEIKGEAKPTSNKTQCPLKVLYCGICSLPTESCVHSEIIQLVPVIRLISE